MEVALVYFAIIAIAFFVLIVRPQRRRLAAHRAFVASIGVGDEVVTTGGVFGTVQALDDDRVDLEVAPGVVIGVARAAIAQSANPAVVRGATEAPVGSSTDQNPVDESAVDENLVDEGTADDSTAVDDRKGDD
jgi:preprotein translocase subunit YajC